MSEQLSALMDGELASDETARQIGALKSDATLRQNWVAYHVLGDALRKSPQLSADFTDKVAAQLAAEPTILAPQRKSQATPRRYAMPLAASVAAVSLVGMLSWQMVRVNQADMPSAIAARPMTATPVLAVKSPPAVPFGGVVSNPYLLAHQEFSPSYAREGIPAYMRTVSEQTENAR